MTEWFDCEIVGKTEYEEGWVFRRPAYKLAFKFNQGCLEGKVTERDVRFAQYCSFNVGDKLRVHLKSETGSLWHFV